MNSRPATWWVRSRSSWRPTCGRRVRTSAWSGSATTCPRCRRAGYWVRLSTIAGVVPRRRCRPVAEPCSVAEARMAYPDAALWGAEIIFVSAPPSPEEQDQLNRLAADHRRTIAVVVVGDVINSPWRFVVDEKNQAVCRLLGLGSMPTASIRPSSPTWSGCSRRPSPTRADKRRAEQDMPAYEFSTTDLACPRRSGGPARPGRGGRPGGSRTAGSRCRPRSSRSWPARTTASTRTCWPVRSGRAASARSCGTRPSSTPAAGSVSTRCTPTSRVAGC